MQKNVQTTLIPAGGAVDRRVPHRGAGQLRAGRPLDLPRLQQGRAGDPEGRRRRGQDDLLRQGSSTRSTSATAPAPNLAAVTAATKAAASRHADAGRPDQGRPGAVRRHLLGLPPGQRRGLAGRVPAAGEVGLPRRRSEARRSTSLLHGLTGKVTVNGSEYNSVMPPMNQLNDDEVANILTYVLNSWGNPGGRSSNEDVKKVRAAKPPPRSRARGAT